MSAAQDPGIQVSSQAKKNADGQSHSPERPLNLRHCLIAGAIGIPIAGVTLVGFPLLALNVAQGVDCCFNESVAGLITFWAAVLAGMLALFGLLISGIYIFTAFKIDIGAKKAARDEAFETAERIAPEAAKTAAGEFYEKYRSRELQNFRDVVEEITQSARERSESVNETLDKAQRETQEALALAQSSKIDMEKGVEEFSRVAAEGHEEMASQVSRIRDLAIASDANISNAADEAKRAAQKADEAADGATRSAQEAKEMADEANLGKSVDEAKMAATRAEEFAQEAKKAADEAEEYARRASGGDSAPESA